MKTAEVWDAGAEDQQGGFGLPPIAKEKDVERLTKPKTGLVAYYWDDDWMFICGNGKREIRRYGFTKETWQHCIEGDENDGYV